MGQSKKPSGTDANLEPLGGRKNSSGDKTRSDQNERNTRALSSPRSQTRTYQSFRAARPRSRSPPRRSSHYSPRSARLRSRRRSRNLHRQPHQRIRSRSPRRVSSSRSYRSRSPPHRLAPRDRGVANSDYYRPSYAVQSASKSPESKGQAASSLVPAHNTVESLDNEETPATESWAELASRKHREWTAPAPTSPDLPSIIEESWVEMASRKHQEFMVIEASKATALAQTTPTTPAKSRDARSLFSERTRLRDVEGLDIQQQVSSLIYPRKFKPGSIKPKVGVAMESRKADIASSTSAQVSVKHLRNSSMDLYSVPERGSISSRQNPLYSFPVPDPPENLYVPAQIRHLAFPPKVRINTEILKPRIQELRRASAAREKSRPIQSIMDEPFFADDDFEAQFPYDVEPVVPTHWQD